MHHSFGASKDQAFKLSRSLETNEESFNWGGGGEGRGERRGVGGKIASRKGTRRTLMITTIRTDA